MGGEFEVKRQWAGNVSIDWDWDQIIQGKRFYWVEVMDYSPEACCILITDIDYPFTSYWAAFGGTRGVPRRISRCGITTGLKIGSFWSR